MTKHPSHTEPQVGDTVTHPLYPELGTGTVETANTGGQPGFRSGRIRWATGQVSSHCLSILRRADQDPHV